MTQRLIIHLPNTSITIDSDNINKLYGLSDFCKKNLEAYHASENHEELTIDNLDENKSSEFYSMIHQLGLW